MMKSNQHQQAIAAQSHLLTQGRMGSANGGGDPAKSDKKSRGLIRRLITVVRWLPPVRAQRRAMPSGAATLAATLAATCL
jgi:hypothetical protein